MNSNFDNVLVTLLPSGSCIRVEAYTAAHGFSSFYMNRHSLHDWFNGDSSHTFLDVDLDDFCRIYRNGSKIRMLLYMLHSDGGNRLSGYTLTLNFPAVYFDHVLDGLAVTFVSYTEETRKSKIVVSPRAQQEIVKLRSDNKHAFRALLKALRNGFQYGEDSTVTLYRDWGNDFIFKETYPYGTDGITGGLVLSQFDKHFPDSEHTCCRYEIHT